MPGLPSFSRVLIMAGVTLVVVGVVWRYLPKMPWLGRLPGDILIQRPRLTIYLPLGTCLAVSVVASLALWLWSRFFR